MKNCRQEWISSLVGRTPWDPNITPDKNSPIMHGFFFCWSTLTYTYDRPQLHAVTHQANLQQETSSLI